MNNFEDKTDDRKEETGQETAFPTIADIRFNADFLTDPGITKRQYAAIHLRIPDSGIGWLDKMIAKAEKRDITVEAMTVLISGLMLRFKEPSYSDSDMLVEALERAEDVYKQRLKNAETAIILDDRITELEGQRNLLFAAAEEMLKIVECTEFESDDDAPDNDDMNRWHRALQI